MFNPIIGLIHQLEFTTGHLLDHHSTAHQTKDKYIFIILHWKHEMQAQFWENLSDVWHTHVFMSVLYFQPWWAREWEVGLGGEWSVSHIGVRIMLSTSILDGVQWWIQDFPEEGAPTPKTAIILQLHENERIWTPRGGRASLAPPLGSANDDYTWKSHGHCIAYWDCPTT